MAATRASSPSPRALARVLVACAVLAGLFLMHGLPASSCATQAGAAATPMTGAAMAGHSSAGQLSATAGSMDPSIDALLATPVAGPSLSAAGSSTEPGGAGAGMVGGMCVSTPPPASDLAGLLALLLLAVGAVVCRDRVGPPSAARRFRRGDGRRAPPPAGSDLLLKLCISRT